jgi:hypothetical protein
MRALRILFAILFASAAAAYDIKIETGDAHRIEIDGIITENSYSDYNSAVGAAVSAALDCDSCRVVVVSPLTLVSGTKIKEPPPVILPPIAPDPIVPTAYYSYLLSDDGSLSDPLLLDGAELLPDIVYVDWFGGDVERVKSWCCKTDTLGYDWRVIKGDGGPRYQLDLTRYAGSTESHELYADVFQAGQPTIWGAINHFTIYNDSTPVDPPVVIPPPVVDPPVDVTTEVILSWTTPDQRVDGSPVTISGYVVEIASGENLLVFPIVGGDTNEFKIQKATLGSGTWVFQVAAYDSTPSTGCPDELVEFKAMTNQDQQDFLDSMNEAERDAFIALGYSCDGPLMSAFSEPVSAVIE